VTFDPGSKDHGSESRSYMITLSPHAGLSPEPVEICGRLTLDPGSKDHGSESRSYSARKVAILLAIGDQEFTFGELSIKA
jgi:hypothetical protein